MGVCGKDFIEIPVGSLSPLCNVFVNLCGAHNGNNVLADVVELYKVEKTAAGAHFLEVERELCNILSRVCSAPVLKVGVDKREQVFEHAFLREALVDKVAYCRLGVLALGKLALVARFLVNFKHLRSVCVLGAFVAAGTEKLDVLGHGGNPFLAADNVGRSHKVVVTGVGKVVGRYAVGLEKHLVNRVFGHFNFAPDNVIKCNSLVFVAL